VAIENLGGLLERLRLCAPISQGAVMVWSDLVLTPQDIERILPANAATREAAHRD
jgi:hypothetical protein